MQAPERHPSNKFKNPIRNQCQQTPLNPYLLQEAEQEMEMQRVIEYKLCHKRVYNLIGGINLTQKYTIRGVREYMSDETNKSNIILSENPGNENTQHRYPSENMGGKCRCPQHT